MADTNPSPDNDTPGPQTRGRTITIVVLGVVVAALIGVVIWLLVTKNTSPTPVPTPTPTPSATTSSSPRPTPTPTSSGTATCGINDLTITLGEMQGAAGSRTVPIVFTNNGTAPCTLNGYPTVSFVGDGNGTTIGPVADEDPATTPVQQTVQPGAAVNSQLRIAVAQNYANCTLVTPDGLRIAPPQSTKSAFVAITSLSACNNPDIQLLTVQAVAP